jgi:hypothetical protein
MSSGPQMALTLFLSCAGLWLFADTLLLSLDRDEMARKAVVRETLIEVGHTEGCTAKVSLELWAEINRLEVYRRVVECEDARK